MTAFSEAFAKAGVRAEDVEFDKAIAKYLNAGGTVERARARLALAAERMSARGLSGNADQGHTALAPSRQTVEDGGAAVGLPSGHHAYAQSSSSNHDERGRLSDANGGQSAFAPSRRVPDRGGDGQSHGAQSSQKPLALPVREPTQQQRAASSAVAKVAAKTIMDDLKIDGIPIGDYTLSECERRGKQKTTEGFIMLEVARLVRNSYANADGGMAIRHIATDGMIELSQQKALEHINA